MELAKLENQAITDQEAAFRTFKALAIEMTTRGLESNHSRLAYDRAITDFFLWYEGQERPELRLMLARIIPGLPEGSGQRGGEYQPAAFSDPADDPASRGKTISFQKRPPDRPQASKGFPGLVDPLGSGLQRDKRKPSFELCRVKLITEKRDFALIALALSSGLRRSEIASLTLNHIQQVESRWALLGLVGKRNKIRDVPITAWAKAALEDWIGAAGITEGRIFRPINKGAS
jgi:integrase